MAGNDIHHIEERDLERFYLRMLHGVELTVIEEHLLLCPKCDSRLAETQRYIEAIRALTAGENVLRGA